MRIKYKKKKKKAHKLYGQKYRGYGQIGRHRHHPGGRGRAGVKDHLKLKLLKEGYEFGSGRGFTRHAVKARWKVYTLRQLDSIVRKYDLKVEESKYVIDLSNEKFVKVLGTGKITFPIKLIVNEKAVITEKAQNKIERAGGLVVKV